MFIVGCGLVFFTTCMRSRVLCIWACEIGQMRVTCTMCVTSLAWYTIHWPAHIHMYKYTMVKHVPTCKSTNLVLEQYKAVTHLYKNTDLRMSTVNCQHQDKRLLVACILKKYMYTYTYCTAVSTLIPVAGTYIYMYNTAHIKSTLYMYIHIYMNTPLQTSVPFRGGGCPGISPPKILENMLNKGDMSRIANDCPGTSPGHLMAILDKREIKCNHKLQGFLILVKVGLKCSLRRPNIKKFSGGWGGGEYAPRPPRDGSVL